MKRECPVCKTGEFLRHNGATHAAGYDVEEGHESYLCDKCGGEFDVRYQMKNDKYVYLNIKYKGTRTTDKSGYHA